MNETDPVYMPGLFTNGLILVHREQLIAQLKVCLQENGQPERQNHKVAIGLADHLEKTADGIIIRSLVHAQS